MSYKAISTVTNCINNIINVKKKTLILNISKFSYKIIEKLNQINIIKRFFTKNRKIICILNKKYIELKYIRKIKMFSKPSKKNFYKLKKLIKEKKNLYIINTNKGIKTTKEAIKERIGGEVIIFIER